MRAHLPWQSTIYLHSPPLSDPLVCAVFQQHQGKTGREKKKERNSVRVTFSFYHHGD
jgi:hypothetical protein